MAKKTKYLVISNQEKPGIEWGAALQETLGICHTCAKAYEIAVFLAGITRPDKSYRKILDTVKLKGAATLAQVEGAQAATIVKVKIY
jgi:hypothetical protein